MYWFPESSALTVNVGFKGTSWSKDDFNSRWFPEHKCGQAPSDHWGSLQSAGEHTLQVVVVVVSRDVRDLVGWLEIWVEVERFPRALALKSAQDLCSCVELSLPIVCT